MHWTVRLEARASTGEVTTTDLATFQRVAWTWSNWGKTPGEHDLISD